MPFVEAPTYDYSDTRKRTSSSYVKFSPDYRVILRMLNPQAKLVWKHWLSEANAGRGMMANCPNTSSQIRPCPIEKSLVGLAKDNTQLLERRAKKRYIVNVLDRTPYTICNACNDDTPKAQVCQTCGATLKNHDFGPLNRVKLLEGGPRLFVENLMAVEKMQKEDFPEAEITDYDITFTTTGIGRERRIAPIPQAPSVLPEDALLNSETGETQSLFDLDLLAEPSSLEEINLMLTGATLEEINATRGVV